jgi:hypothetical protein
MTVIFAEREPTQAEFEKFRLLLSTYQDGTGMLAIKSKSQLSWTTQNNAKTMPGWRDFERAIALAFHGTAIESKWIYDVLLPDTNRAGVYYGISCKMRSELSKASGSLGRITIELSNAAGEFWDTIKTRTGLNEDNYSAQPAAIGQTLLELVESWHRRVDIDASGNIDSSRSCFLSLQWNKGSGNYQLFQFPLTLPDASTLAWQVLGRRLVAHDDNGVLFEWYGHSGGQLKYYPPVTQAIWQSRLFQLEPLPADLEHIAFNKAATYFPYLWDKVR